MLNQWRWTRVQSMSTMSPMPRRLTLIRCRVRSITILTAALILASLGNAAAQVPPAAPPPESAPALIAEPAAPPPPWDETLYKKPWFWAAFGVLALTAGLIIVSTSASAPETPKTDLGNMRAF
jgi:hypothetical protein